MLLPNVQVINEIIIADPSSILTPEGKTERMEGIEIIEEDKIRSILLGNSR